MTDPLKYVIITTFQMGVVDHSTSRKSGFD